MKVVWCPTNRFEHSPSRLWIVFHGGVRTAKASAFADSCHLSTFNPSGPRVEQPRVPRYARARQNCHKKTTMAKMRLFLRSTQQNSRAKYTTATESAQHAAEQKPGRVVSRVSTQLGPAAGTLERFLNPQNITAVVLSGFFSPSHMAQ